MTDSKNQISLVGRVAPWFSKNRYPLLAFIVSFAALVLYAVGRGLAPFGDGSLLCRDLWGQYYPMIVDSIENPFSLWSWEGALGFNAIVQNAYYTNSIFNFLLLPFSSYARLSAMDFLLFGKLSLSAALFAYFLEKKGGKGSFLTMALGMAYGLSAYMIAYIAQPMWLDLAIWVPLVILGLERMLAGGKPWLYVVFLSLSIYSNFYIGFAVCIFTGLWFVAAMLTDGVPRNAKRVFRDTGKFALLSLASAALSAFVLLPLYYGMQTWISSSLSFEKEIGFYHSLSQVIDNMTVMAKSSWEYGVANIYCGAAVMFFFLLFLLNDRVSVKKRIVFGVFTVFMLLSFELNILDFIWHGFHFPNQLPGRQSFLFVFLVLTAAHETLTKTEGLSPLKIIFSVLIAAGFFFVGIGESADPMLRLVSAMIVLVCGIILLLPFAMRTESMRRFSASALSFLIMAEALTSGIVVLERYGRSTDAVAYSRSDSDMAALTEKYESETDDFYRTEMTQNFTFDPGMLYGYHGISYYSSTMNGSIYAMMQRLGNRVYALNVSTIYQPTPIQDMMFAVKYHYATNDNQVGYAETIEKTETVTVKKSPYALPVAYVVSDRIKSYTSEGKLPMEAQGDFLYQATGGAVSTVHEAFGGVLRYDNARFFMSGGKEYYTALDPQTSTVVTYTMDATASGAFFLDFEYNVGTYEVYIDGRKVASGECGRAPLCYVGEVEEYMPINVIVTTKGYSTVLCGVHGYTVSDEALSAAHEMLSAGALDVERATDTKIKGSLHATEDGVLYSSIPANVGWEIYIDGEKAQTFAVDGALLACEITAGEHEVVYRYRMPGLMGGILLSLLGAFILTGYAFYKKKQKKKTE